MTPRVLAVVLALASLGLAASAACLVAERHARDAGDRPLDCRCPTRCDAYREPHGPGGGR